MLTQQQGPDLEEVLAKVAVESVGLEIWKRRDDVQVLCMCSRHLLFAFPMLVLSSVMFLTPNLYVPDPIYHVFPMYPL